MKRKSDTTTEQAPKSQKLDIPLPMNESIIRKILSYLPQQDKLSFLLTRKFVLQISQKEDDDEEDEEFDFYDILPKFIMLDYNTTDFFFSVDYKIIAESNANNYQVIMSDFFKLASTKGISVFVFDMSHEVVKDFLANETIDHNIFNYAWVAKINQYCQEKATHLNFHFSIKPNALIFQLLSDIGNTSEVGIYLENDIILVASDIIKVIEIIAHYANEFYLIISDRNRKKLSELTSLYGIKEITSSVIFFLRYEDQ